MKLKQLLLSGIISLVTLGGLMAQPTICPAPNPGDPNCYQTSRPAAGNPLTNWPPIPHQDCCNAIPLCQPVNNIDNGVVIPPNAPAGTLYPGCVQNELPSDANTCFSNNEKATTWYKFQIRPLPGGPTAPGSPAGKLRFKIIPLDVFDDPDYDPEATDDGATGYGNTDYDFLLFKIPATAANDGAACTAIKNSSSFGTPGSAIASCNWTGTRGPTGLFEPGTGTDAAQGPATRFNKPINVKVGDLFYLAIDNFSVNTQGFIVDFRGHPNMMDPEDSTAIVNPPPVDSIKIKRVDNPKCTIQTFKICFDKPVRCDSVRPEKFNLESLSPGYNPSIVSILPEGGCNPGGQDSCFVLTINPFEPDRQMRISVIADIRDICGNKVLLDSTRLKIDALRPLTFALDTNVTSCGIPELTIKFAKPVFCDSVKASKFSILYNGAPYGLVGSVKRKNGLPCSATTLDTLYTLRFTQALKDSSRFALALNGIIRDECGNPVILDTIPFIINPFLTAKADPAVVCPKRTTTLTAILDSTFKTYQTDSLEFRWFNTNTNTLMVEDDENSFAPNNEGILKIRRDLVQPEEVMYRLIVRNRRNGCSDTTQIKVRYSARPELEEQSTLTYCFGETVAFKPKFTNASPSQLVYNWFRKNLTADTLSKDSVFTQLVDSALVAKGLLQTYTLNVRFTDSLGGCVANPYDLNIRYGRRITPQILIDPSQVYASITPADFTFGNGSNFFPPKAGARFDWDFGKDATATGNSQTTNGSQEATTTYLEGKKGGAGYVVTLTAYDTLYASSTLVGKICSNNDTTTVYVQNLLPSLVTSDGDGLNDNFYVKGMRPNTFSMKLYNRWGKLVGEQDPFEVDGWDPKDVGPGIYYYILTEKRSGKTLVSWLTITK